MLTGSYASSYYGTPRATQDLDFVIAPTSEGLRHLTTEMPESDYAADPDQAEEALRSMGQFNIIDLESGWKIDFIVRKQRDFSLTEFERRRRVRIGSISVDLASAEDIVVAKLEWAKLGESERQLRDVAGILRVQGPSLDRRYVEHWITSLGLSKQWALARRMAGEES